MLRAAIVGCGKLWKTPGASGTGISHQHAKGYRHSPHTELVAVADIVRENAETFVQEHGPAAIHTDYVEMVRQERPDVVSVCTWPHLHAPMVEQLAELGVRAIHCEKPMAPTWGEARRMMAACEAAGVQLTVNHQRRFDPAYVLAKGLLDSGRIGALRRLEMPTDNLFDWGTHWFDMAFFLNRQTPARWVLAAVEPTGGPSVFGVRLEGRGLSQVWFDNDVHAILATGRPTGYEFQVGIVGERGTIQIGYGAWDAVRVRADGEAAWEEHAPDYQTGSERGFEPAISDLAQALETGAEPELSARKALMATELIFASYESARRGRRVDLPLDAEDVAVYAEG